MRAGPLRQRITIEQRTLGASSETGEPLRVWTTFTTAWASVSPMSAKELFFAEAVTPEATHLITMRYQAGVTSAMRVKHRGRYLNIVSIRNIDERRREIELLCKEETAT